MENNNIYTMSEKVDIMLLVFGECTQNSTEAAILYAQRYPDRRYIFKVF